MYIQPAWHPSGVLVACGSTAPTVNVWDIRYHKLDQPSQTIATPHDKRILRCAFHPKDDCLLTVSSDCHLAFNTYHSTMVRD